MHVHRKVLNEVLELSHADFSEASRPDEADITIDGREQGLVTHDFTPC